MSSLTVSPARTRRAGSQRRVADAGFLLLAAVSAVLEVWWTQGTTFFADDWEWILHRRGSSLDTFLRPYNGHLSLLPILIAHALYATVGLRSYVPSRALLLIGELVVAGLVYAYARARLPPPAALVAGAAILFLGAGWDDLLWPFQLAWMLSLAGGVGALLSLDRGGARAPWLAAGCLAVSLASSSVGIAFALVAVIDVAARPELRRRAWPLLVPCVAYAAWWIGWQTASTGPAALPRVPGVIGNELSGTAAALFGLTGDTVPLRRGTILVFGPPLAIALGLVLAGRAWRVRGDTVRRVALLVGLLAFGALIGLARGRLSHGYESRYLYVGAVLGVLLICEVWRGTALPRAAAGALAVIAVAVLVANLVLLHRAGTYLQGQAQATRADLAAVDIARPVLEHRPGYVASEFPGWPLVQLRAGLYFAATRSLGTPADSVAQLTAAPPAERALADVELERAEDVLALPARRPATADRCDRAEGRLLTSIPPGGVWISGRASAAVRRFGPDWVPVGAVRGTALVDPPPDASGVPWTLQVLGPGRLSVCRDG